MSPCMSMCPCECVLPVPRMGKCRLEMGPGPRGPVPSVSVGPRLGAQAELLAGQVPGAGRPGWAEGARKRGGKGQVGRPGNRGFC